jgi:hypothetical protein
MVGAWERGHPFDWKAAFVSTNYRPSMGRIAKTESHLILFFRRPQLLPSVLPIVDKEATLDKGIHSVRL